MKILFRSLVIVVLGLGTASVAQAGFFDDWFGGDDAQDAAGEKPAEANIKADPPPPPPGPDANPVMPLTTLPDVNTLTPEQLVRYQLTQCQDQLDQCRNPRPGSNAPEGFTGRGGMITFPRWLEYVPDSRLFRGFSCRTENPSLVTAGSLSPGSRLYDLMYAAHSDERWRRIVQSTGLEYVSQPLTCTLDGSRLLRFDRVMGEHLGLTSPEVQEACWHLHSDWPRKFCDFIWFDSSGSTFVGNFR